MNSDTQVSRASGALLRFSAGGRHRRRYLGANGQRITAQVLPASFSRAMSSKRPTDVVARLRVSPAISRFSVRALRSARSGNVRTGTPGLPNPIYSLVYGANSMPLFRALCDDAAGVAHPPGDNPISQPSGWDFRCWNDLYIGIDLGSGSYINCGTWGQTVTYRVDDAGNTDRTFGWVSWGVCAYSSHIQVVAGCHSVYGSSPRDGPATRRQRGKFAVTGWFSVPGCSVVRVLQRIAESGTLSVVLHESVRRDQYYELSASIERHP